MSCLFPEYKDRVKNRLYIIGNGFDVASGVKSCYSHFKNWLIERGEKNIVSLMNVFFGHFREFWGDIENALGEYDEENILDLCKPDKEIDYEHGGRYAVRVEDAPTAELEPLLNAFRELFVEWVDSIDLTKAKKIRNLPEDSRYLTFNYTETLENVYGIPLENICHIHGSRLRRDEYVFGHCHYCDPIDAYSRKDKFIFEQSAYETIVRLMNVFFKDVDSIIDGHKEYFEGLSNIQDVVVWGHSFNEVDWPYFAEIIKRTGTEIPWYISYYKSDQQVWKNDFEKREYEDGQRKYLERIDSFKLKYSLLNVKIFDV